MPGTPDHPKSGKKERNLHDITLDAPEGTISSYFDGLPASQAAGTSIKEGSDAQEASDDVPIARMSSRKRRRKPVRPMSSAGVTKMSISPDIPDSAPPRRRTPRSRKKPATEAKAKPAAVEPLSPKSKAKHGQQTKRKSRPPKSPSPSLQRELLPRRTRGIGKGETGKYKEESTTDSDASAEEPRRSTRGKALGVSASETIGLSSSRKSKANDQGPSASKKAKSKRVVQTLIEKLDHKPQRRGRKSARLAEVNQEAAEQSVDGEAGTVKTASRSPSNGPNGPAIPVFAGSSTRRLEGKYHVAASVIETMVDSEACVVGPKGFLLLAKIPGPWEDKIFLSAEEGYVQMTLAAWLKAACQECKMPTDEETMLVCDGCEQNYHMGCLSPPLTSVPKGDWFCLQCTQ